MFREMRRKKQTLQKNEIESILYNGTSGILAVHGDENYPYAVPISFVYESNRIYFHCAKAGHKLDAIKRNSKVCFTVIGQDEIIPDQFTTFFSSVIAFGRARVIEDDQEKMKALVALSEKYSPNLEQAMKAEIEKSFKHLLMVVIEIDHVSGKKAIELM